MKRVLNLLIYVALPISIILFGTVTKWFFALVEDGPDEIFKGFPLPYVCSGWHTSLSLQFFVSEMIIDLLFYFIVVSFFVIVIYSVFDISIKPMFTYALRLIAIFVTCIGVFLASNPDNIFHLKLSYKIEVYETGYSFTWSYIDRPDIYKYRPDLRPQQ